MSKKQMTVGVLSKLGPDGSNPFAAIIDHGVKVTQVCSWEVARWTPATAKRVVTNAKKGGIRVNSMWAGYSGRVAWNFIDGPSTLGLVPPETRAQRVKDLKKGADFAEMIGAPAIVTHCGFIPENWDSPLYQPTLDAIGEVAEYCRKKGLEFWFETGQETPVTLLRTIEDLGMPNLGINFDTANVILYGKGNPLDALDVFGKYVKCLHAKDGLYPTNGRQLGKEVPVGEGKSQYEKLIPKLYEMGFKGDLIIEREITGEQQTKDIVKTIIYLNKLIDKAAAKDAAKTVKDKAVKAPAKAAKAPAKKAAAKPAPKAPAKVKAPAKKAPAKAKAKK